MGYPITSLPLLANLLADRLQIDHGHAKEMAVRLGFDWADYLLDATSSDPLAKDRIADAIR